MMNTKLDEIAQRVAKEMYGTEFLLEHETKFGRKLLTELLAELSKDVEPACYVPEQTITWLRLAQSESAYCHADVAKNDITADYVPVFTHPIPANTAEIEQRVAEAIAKYLDYEWSVKSGDGVRSGKWREFL